MVRHFLRDDDLSPKEQQEVLDLALKLKQDRFLKQPLAGPKTVAVLFDKTSTRTRLSFAVGIADLGGTPLIIDSGVSQLGAKESITDTARVMERMVEMVVWRTYAQSNLEEMAENASIPVINSLSDDFHPCQLLADLLTIYEHKGKLKGLTLSYFGDGANNMSHSYLLACATAGMNVKIAAPASYHPNGEVVERAKEIAQEFGSTITVTDNPEEAASGADVLVTDTWVSMGSESEKDERIATFQDFQVTEDLMKRANSDAIFMHCLPAYRGLEVAAEVIDGPQSVIWDEAENRLHAQKALMVWLLENNTQ